MPLSLVAAKMPPGYLIDIDTLCSMIIEVGMGALNPPTSMGIDRKAYFLIKAHNQGLHQLQSDS